VELTPTDKSRSFFKAFLYIDKTQHTLVSIKWLDKGGTKYTLTTKNLNGNAAISDAQLAYNKAKFPGAEEVDLRN
jgi:outer membrane lipoprotein-sorting protein